ncbi:MAG: glycosyltransferase family 2 protein [Solirubrobacteraceae bacterium]
MRLSVVIPVKDGARHLAEVLAAVAREAPGAQVLVVDSGSRDGSPDIARRAGARVHEIAPEEFGHGRTRNLGAEQTAGDVIAFLTQDATPLPGWGAALLAPFEDTGVGVVVGPQRPRPGTPPSVARELEWFFGHLDADDAYLSNVNAAYRRACWEEVRFPDVAYAEDQAFGRALQDTRWRKVVAPEAAVLHSHDYGTVESWRRAFDEARGLRETRGWVERIAPRATLGGIVRQARRDDRWMRAQGWSAVRRAAWWPRSLLLHAGRKGFAWLGSRADRLPPAVRRTLSLERRAD